MRYGVSASARPFLSRAVVSITTAQCMRHDTAKTHITEHCPKMVSPSILTAMSSRLRERVATRTYLKKLEKHAARDGNWSATGKGRVLAQYARIH